MTVCWLLTVTRGLLPAAGWLAPPEHPPRDEWPMGVAMPRLTAGRLREGRERGAVKPARLVR